MFARLSFSYYDIKDSLWFRPALMTLGIVFLAFVTLTLDHQLLDGENVDTWWLFAGGVTGGRGVLTVIAGTMMTVVTMAFSFTMVALQLGSSQYSPRILRNFTGDRGNQTVLGTFIATFVYCLLVLRSVQSDAEDRTAFVPSLSISVAIVLALLCIASLIYFLHHATRTIQASVILHTTANDTRRLIRDHLDHVADVPMSDLTRALCSRLPAVTTVTSNRAGYIRGIDASRLQYAAISQGMLLTIHARIGDHLFTGSPIATVQRFVGLQSGDHEDEEVQNGMMDRIENMLENLIESDPEPDPSDDDEEPYVPEEIEQITDEVRGAFTLGLERTLNEDALFGFQQLTDIGLRAMSPAINDPRTAMLCLDQLGECLIRVRGTDERPTVAVDDDEVPRVVYPVVSFDQFMRISVQHIRHYAAGDPFVCARLASVLKAVWDVAGDSPAGKAVREEARRVVEAVAGKDPLPSELALVREAAAWAHIPADAVATMEPGSAVAPE